MAQLAEKSKCTGCAACYNKCSVGALEMISDETGFLFPVIDQSKCVECGACEKACPVLDKVTVQPRKPNAYIVQHKDDTVRLQSTSGGAYTAIATQILARGGVVFGAAFQEDYYVRHTEVQTVDQLSIFRSSKYVQSEIGDSFRRAKKYLQEGRWVCFSGTPCQIQGLKKYLGKHYDKLITVDFMCRAVPSPKVFHKYLEYQKRNYPNFQRLVFRDKGLGYSYSTMALYDHKDSQKCVYRGGSESDQWLRLFLKGYCNRPSCYLCPFQTGDRVSDYTLWDCWGTENYAPELNDNKGTTNVIVWTQLGHEIFEEACNHLKVKEIGIDAIDASLERLSALSQPEYDKAQFYKDVDEMEAAAFFNKYVPMTPKICLKKFGRYMLHKFHLHDLLRRSVHKIRERNKKH